MDRLRRAHASDWWSRPRAFPGSSRPAWGNSQMNVSATIPVGRVAVAPATAAAAATSVPGDIRTTQRMACASSSGVAFTSAAARAKAASSTTMPPGFGETDKASRGSSSSPRNGACRRRERRGRQTREGKKVMSVCLRAERGEYKWPRVDAHATVAPRITPRTGGLRSGLIGNGSALACDRSGQTRPRAIFWWRAARSRERQGRRTDGPRGSQTCRGGARWR